MADMDLMGQSTCFCAISLYLCNSNQKKKVYWSDVHLTTYTSKSNQCSTTLLDKYWRVNIWQEANGIKARLREMQNLEGISSEQQWGYSMYILIDTTCYYCSLKGKKIKLWVQLEGLTDVTRNRFYKTRQIRKIVKLYLWYLLHKIKPNDPRDIAGMISKKNAA